MKSKQISGCFVCILIILIILYYNFRPKKVITEGIGRDSRGGYSGMRRSRGFGRGWAGNSGYYTGGTGTYAVNPIYTNSYMEEDYPFYYYPYYLYKRLYYD